MTYIATVYKLQRLNVKKNMWQLVRRTGCFMYINWFESQTLLFICPIHERQPIIELPSMSIESVRKLSLWFKELKHSRKFHNLIEQRCIIQWTCFRFTGLRLYPLLQIFLCTQTGRILVKVVTQFQFRCAPVRGYLLPSSDIHNIMCPLILTTDYRLRHGLLQILNGLSI